MLPPQGTRERWERNKRRIRRWIDRHGWDERRGAYRMAKGSSALDVSVLLHTVSGYDRGERMSRTIDALREELGRGPLLYRYSGMEREEGAFTACAFWTASALACVGRVDEATALMDELVATVPNDVGIMAEMVDAATGDFLGNLPQALSHLALVQAASVIREPHLRSRGSAVPARIRTFSATRRAGTPRTRRVGQELRIREIGQRRRAAASSTRSTDSCSPMEIRMPSPANARTTTPCSWNTSSAAAVRSPSAEPDEVALRVRHVEAERAQPLHEPGARADDVVDAGEQQVLVVERDETRELRLPRHRQRDRDRARGVEDVLRPDGVPEAQAREPPRLRERAEEHEVRVAADQGRAVDRLRVADELEVRLVEQHEHVGGDARHEALEVGGRDDRAGRVVRRADDDRARAVGHRRRHRVEVVRRAGPERHLDARAAGDRDEARVRLEGPPGVDDLAARLADREQELAEQRDRAGAEVHLLRASRRTGRRASRAAPGPVASG